MRARRAARGRRGGAARRPAASPAAARICTAFSGAGRRARPVRPARGGGAARSGLLVDRGTPGRRSARRGGRGRLPRGPLALDETPAPEAHLNLALAELARGRDVGRRAHLLRAVALRPDYRKAHFHLARHYARRGVPAKPASCRPRWRASSAPAENYYQKKLLTPPVAWAKATSMSVHAEEFA